MKSAQTPELTDRIAKPSNGSGSFHGLVNQRTLVGWIVLDLDHDLHVVGWKTT
jgi:hypothetical protein